MRAKTLSMVLGLSVLMLVGIQVLSPPSAAFIITATVDVKPDTLNLNRHGRWITVFIGLPEGYNVTDINSPTILLEGLFGPEWSNIEGEMLVVKFDGFSVTGYLWDRLYHMGAKRASVELRVTGQLRDGTEFAGSDTISIMDPIEG